MSKSRITDFSVGGVICKVEFVETLQVKDRIECDVYAFVGDDSMDLAIVRVQKGCKTPLQRVILGTETIEGFVDGAGVLTVRSGEDSQEYKFGPGLENMPVTIHLGKIMQWQASADTDLTFYEMCKPPYADGRFENLSE